MRLSIVHEVRIPSITCRNHDPSFAGSHRRDALWNGGIRALAVTLIHRHECETTAVGCEDDLRLKRERDAIRQTFIRLLGRATKGGRRRAGDERRATNGGRRRAGDERRATNGGRRRAGDERRATNGGRRTAGDERRATNGGRRTAGTAGTADPRGPSRPACFIPLGIEAAVEVPLPPRVRKAG
jgi:hypothetical protein